MRSARSARIWSPIVRPRILIASFAWRFESSSKGTFHAPRWTARSPCRTRSTAPCGIRCGRTSNSTSALRFPQGVGNRFHLLVTENDSRPPVEKQRLACIDWARGLAVLLMIGAHTLDAWTRLDARATIAFRNATILGGFAAPLFLWLAGVGVAVATGRTAERRGPWAAVDAASRRGLKVFVLGLLFRLQALVLTPGGALVSLFRVDILNVMGLAMVAAALLWGPARSAAGRVAVLSVAAAACAMATPVVRASVLVDRLPVWLQWYVRPFGDMTTFTLFPWAAFLFAGGAAGVLVAASGGGPAERRMHAALAASGAALVVLGLYTASRPALLP